MYIIGCLVNGFCGEHEVSLMRTLVGGGCNLKRQHVRSTKLGLEFGCFCHVIHFVVCNSIHNIIPSTTESG